MSCAMQAGETVASSPREADRRVALGRGDSPVPSRPGGQVLCQAVQGDRRGAEERARG